MGGASQPKRQKRDETLPAGERPGVLTYLGVTRLGTEVEMNQWLVTLMHAFGAVPALVSAKALACVCGAILYFTAYHRPLAIATGLYIGLAIVPWMFIVATTA